MLSESTQSTETMFLNFSPGTHTHRQRSEVSNHFDNKQLSI